MRASTGKSCSCRLRRHSDMHGWCKSPLEVAAKNKKPTFGSAFCMRRGISAKQPEQQRQPKQLAKQQRKQPKRLEKQPKQQRKQPTRLAKQRQQHQPKRPVRLRQEQQPVRMQQELQPERKQPVRLQQEQLLLFCRKQPMQQPTGKRSTMFFSWIFLK